MQAERQRNAVEIGIRNKEEKSFARMALEEKRQKAEKDMVKDELKRMLDRDFIKQSKSPLASPVVLVRKKDGTRRFSVDSQARVNTVM